ncbi:ABC transporter permease [Spirosoma terrae]|uniref:FtsX-like permease family protein n=1 Tax=Spirosoma terrae TaxID=1968276 RepID=A0A6L9LFL3_9BACT|nr:ABC transporter permease [Spirosoma terrae]NDU97663.1 FtsX-like permease family protein [Spirosoma terrae]
MLKNYLKIAWRNLAKYPTTTGINLIGLTLGLTTCLLILLFVRYESGFDRFHPLGERVYRINEVVKTGDDLEKSGIVPYPLGDAIRSDFSDWPVVASIHAEENTSVVISPEKILSEYRVLFAEPQLFDLFALTMKVGDPKTILSQPNQVILTESAARTYFGNASPIGKTFRLGETVRLRVAGVMQDMSAQTHLKSSMIVSYKTLKSYLSWDITQWGLRSSGSVYVLLPEGRQPDQYASRLTKASKKYFADENRSGSERHLALQSIEDIHLNPEFEGSPFVPAIEPTYLWVFGIIGLFVLLIACINFVNMATARATTRAKEVGVRKAIGATFNQLIGQFLGEAVWLSLLSATMAVAIAYLVLPTLNGFLQKQITFDAPIVVGFMLVLALLTALSAGTYPAFFMAKLKPVKVLKSRADIGRGSQGWIRQGLVIFQFSVSIILAVAVLVIYQQMKLFREKDLGFSRDAVLTVAIPDPEKISDALRQSLHEIPGIEHISFGIGAPTSRNNFNTGVHPDPANPAKRINVNIKTVDANYLQTYDLKLAAGRFLTDADTLAITKKIPFEQRRYVFVVNEALTKALGYTKPEQALGRKVRIGLNDITAEIVGVVRDFHASSLREAINPVIMLNFAHYYYSAGLKLQTKNYPATMAAVERIWKQYFPNSLYEAEFLDQSLQKQYEEEARQFMLLRIFAGLALVICCLGLWGLATFTIERRTKEIGVRKVLGASTASVVTLLSKDFLKLVLIALCIASPIAWYAMDQWLADFAYKIAIEWWVFAVAGLSAVTIALATVSFQSVKAALMNPVKSLRSE